MKTKILLFCIAFQFFNAKAQNIPHHWQLNESTHQLIIGDVEESGIFNVNVIDTIYLEFSNSNWFNILTTYYTSGQELSATMTYQGNTYEGVGVSFKGQTSYQMTNGEEKKSFNIRLDAGVAGQELDGYDVINLNNCFDDASFLREFIYLYLIRHHIPAASCAFVELVINGESWGLYPMVQQLDGAYINDWFLSNDGTRWRADAPAGTTGGGPGGGGGPQWGDGTAALNYLGDTAADYEDYYTLKATEQADPWAALINTCDVLNNTSMAQLPNLLPDVLDVDRTLWFLAAENVFGDDDSYIYKGKMDYYIYWEPETGRLVPLEFDGNSVLIQQSLNWGVFYHVDNVNFPLLNKLLAVPEYRQRYLAHYRTLISELVDPALDNGLIESWGDVIDPHVEADTKKLYSYNQFVSGVTTLNSYLQQRRNNVMNNIELNTTGASITDVTMLSDAGSWQAPVENEAVLITASVNSSDGIQIVYLYYSDEMVGNFTKIEMMDDGNSGDQSAGDGIYGATIPGFSTGTGVRFYIEAIENNVAKTASYEPAGAEHDVYIYTVMAGWAESADVIINEVMAKNETVAMDEMSQYEDWIELYNRGDVAVDLSDYYITDNSWNLEKWQFPSGAVLQPDSYLILWADEDSTDGAYHTNFRISAAGEAITLLNEDGLIADQVVLGQQYQDLGFARVPNGYGPFVIQGATHGFNNETVFISESSEPGNQIVLYPNPASEFLLIKSKEIVTKIEVYDSHGKLICVAGMTNRLGLQDLNSGVYHLRIEQGEGRISTHRIVKM